MLGDIADPITWVIIGVALAAAVGFFVINRRRNKAGSLDDGEEFKQKEYHPSDKRAKDKAPTGKLTKLEGKAKGKTKPLNPTAQATAVAAKQLNLTTDISVFRTVMLLIGVPMGNTYVVVKRLKARTMQETIKWKGLTFAIDMSKIAYVDKKFPYLLYDYRYMNPINMTNSPDIKQSTIAFNKLFSRNIITQALAALKSQMGFSWIQFILALVMGLAIGYLIGEFFPFYHAGGGTVVTTVTQTATGRAP